MSSSIQIPATPVKPFHRDLLPVSRAPLVLAAPVAPDLAKTLKRLAKFAAPEGVEPDPQAFAAWLAAAPGPLAPDPFAGLDPAPAG